MDYFDELLYVQGLQQIFLEFPRSIENTGSAYDIFRTILRKKIGGGVMLKVLVMGLQMLLMNNCANIKCKRLRTSMKLHIIGCITLRGQHGVSMISHITKSVGIG